MVLLNCFLDFLKSDRVQYSFLFIELVNLYWNLQVRTVLPQLTGTTYSYSLSNEYVCSCNYSVLHSCRIFAFYFCTLRAWPRDYCSKIWYITFLTFFWCYFGHIPKVLQVSSTGALFSIFSVVTVTTIQFSATQFRLPFARQLTFLPHLTDVTCSKFFILLNTSVVIILFYIDVILLVLYT